ncbi:hypothetical protein KSS87_020402 [Heliosperma pusillum]|nr:hypothetical protein KSS87_020402 [Heliosperma pusillum]
MKPMHEFRNNILRLLVLVLLALLQLPFFAGATSEGSPWHRNLREVLVPRISTPMPNISTSQHG